MGLELAGCRIARNVLEEDICEFRSYERFDMTAAGFEEFSDKFGDRVPFRMVRYGDHAMVPGGVPREEFEALCNGIRHGAGFYNGEIKSMEVTYDTYSSHLAKIYAEMFSWASGGFGEPVQAEQTRNGSQYRTKIAGLELTGPCDIAGYLDDRQEI